MPLDTESEICKKSLKLNHETETTGRFISSRKDNDIEALTVKARVGKINCSAATQLIIDQFHPDFIIDTGVSGSLTDTLNIFDIVCENYSYEYDPCAGKALGKIPPEDDQSYVRGQVHDTGMFGEKLIGSLKRMVNYYQMQKRKNILRIWNPSNSGIV